MNFSFLNNAGLARILAIINITFYLLFAISCNAGQSGDREITAEVTTVAGTLKIVKERVLSDGFFDYEVLLNKEQVFKKNREVKKIVGNHLYEDSSFVVMKILTGGSGCAAIYHVIDIGKYGYDISRPFGNCSDIASSKINNDVLIINIGNQLWKYMDGDVERARN